MLDSAAPRGRVARLGVLVLLSAALAGRAWAQESPTPPSNARAPADSAAAAPTTSAQPAAAALVDAETPPAPPEVIFVDHSAPRLRFDVLTGHQLTLAWCCVPSAPGISGGSEPYIGVVGLTLDFGVQWGDHFATYARGAASTTIWMSVGSAYLMAEWTPVRRFSIGAGIGWDGTLAIIGGASGWWGLSIPLSVAWNFGKIDPTTAHRSVFRIGVEGAIGWGQVWDFWGAGPTGMAVHLAYTVGWAWM